MSKVKVERLGELECQCFVGNYAINVMYFERDSSPMAIPSKRLCVENARMTREALKWTNLIGTWVSNASDKRKKKENLTVITLYFGVNVGDAGPGGRLEKRY